MTPEERARHWAAEVRHGAEAWVRDVVPSLAEEIRAAEVEALKLAGEIFDAAQGLPTEERRGNYFRSRLLAEIERRRKA